MAIAAERMSDPVDRLILLKISKFSGEHVTRGAMLQAFLIWAEKHPEKWSHYNGTGVLEALHETWPCK